MSFFKPVPNAFVLLRTSGAYREHKLQVRDSELYAERGDTFVRIRPDGNTSCPKIHWVDLKVPSGVVETQGILLIFTPNSHSTQQVAAE